MASRSDKSHPEDAKNVVSRVTLWWMVPLLWKGSRTPLQQEDLPQVRNKDRSNQLTERLEEKWEQEIHSAKRDNRTPKLWKAMLRYYHFQDYMKYLAFYLVIAIGQNISLYSLINLLQLVSDFSNRSTNDDFRFHEEAMLYVYGIILGYLMEWFAVNHFYLHGAILGNRAKAGVLGLLYKKVLRLSKMSLDSGHAMELICNDSQRLVTSAEWFIPMGLRHILYVANNIPWLLYFIGWQIIPGSIFLLALAALRMCCNTIDYNLRKKASELSDKRLGYIREALTVVYSVKVNCWEKIYEDKIQKTRW